MALNRIVGMEYTRVWPRLGPSWFDHRFDQLRGPEDWHWTERGVFGARLIKPGDIVLDLCCGDGSYSGYFYASRAAGVDAVDHDPKAVDHARAHYPRKNLYFTAGDAVKTPFPRQDYNLILCFAAIEHFSEEDGTVVLKKIRAALQRQQGTFLGSTILVKEHDIYNWEHDNEFESVDQLRAYLTPHFGTVDIWTSQWPYDRTEAYFECRDPLPLDPHD